MKEKYYKWAQKYKNWHSTSSLVPFHSHEKNIYATLSFLVNINNYLINELVPTCSKKYTVNKFRKQQNLCTGHL